MSPEPAPRPASRALLAAAALYGLGIYATLPTGVVVCNDDFGYLKSAVQTLQHGRPWTNDWLEPWAASLSVVSALLYQAIGNFAVATQGLQSALAALSFLGAAALFHARGLRTAWAIAAAAVLLTFPVVLWKTLEYTGLTLYLPCLLGALWAAERKRWLLFFAVWAIAVASRQSAIAWLALPAFEFARALLHRDQPATGEWRHPAAVLALAVPWLALLFSGMNTTHAQIVRTGSIFWRANAGASLMTFAAGLAVFAVAAGIGAFTFALRPEDAASGRPRSRSVILAGVGIAAVALAFDVRRLLDWDIVTLDGSGGWLYSKLLVVAAAAGWLLMHVRVAAAPAALALASLLLVSLRGDRYDYYFADVAIAAVFCLRPSGGTVDSATMPARANRPGWPRLLAGLLLFGLVSFHARFGHGLKLTLDRAWALCSLYEHALRAGKIQPGELREAPFGYAGWHLHPYSAARGSDTFRRFLKFDSGVSTVQWQMSEPAATAPPGTLADETHRLGWFGSRRFVLLRTGPAHARDDLQPGYRLIPFPLESSEWKKLIAGPPL